MDKNSLKILGGGLFQTFLPEKMLTIIISEPEKILIVKKTTLFISYCFDQ